MSRLFCTEPETSSYIYGGEGEHASYQRKLELCQKVTGKIHHYPDTKIKAIVREGNPRTISLKNTDVNL